jgi:nucleoside-diphosphate-sugar epimerase
MRAVFLTGAAGGLGTVMTEALLDDGHAVAAIDRDGPGLARLMERHRTAAAERRLVAIEADIVEADACEDAGREQCARLGGSRQSSTTPGLAAARSPTPPTKAAPGWRR